MYKKIQKDEKKNFLVSLMREITIFIEKLFCCWFTVGVLRCDEKKRKEENFLRNKTQIKVESFYFPTAASRA